MAVFKMPKQENTVRRKMQSYCYLPVKQPVKTAKSLSLPMAADVMNPRMAWLYA